MSTPAKGDSAGRKKRTLDDREKKKKTPKKTEPAEEEKPERKVKTVQRRKTPDEYDYDSSDEEVCGYMLLVCVTFSLPSLFLVRNKH